MNRRDPKAKNAARQELEHFRAVHHLKNHWARPIGPRSYYWFLTFENSPELHSLVTEFQRVISFPYYDLTPGPYLHLSLDRIAFEGDVTAGQVSAIQLAAARACRNISPFQIAIGAFGGTAGAIGFMAYPKQPIQELRDALRAATFSVYPHAPVKHAAFHPHMAIGYANSDGVPTGETAAAVEKLDTMRHVDITVSDSAMVLLERRARSYAWQPVSRIPLTGASLENIQGIFPREGDAVAEQARSQCSR